MIGVTASGIESALVEEFFQLFKTPWKPAKDGRDFQVLFSNEEVERPQLRPGALLIVSSARKTPVDAWAGLTQRSVRSGISQVQWKNCKIPIYGDLATFEAPQSAEVLATCDQQPAALTIELEGLRIVRLGYDFFQQANRLLSYPGQPPEWALTPTLEWHFSTLRNLILQAGLPLVEVPPAPQGADFICCLTHDIDFFGIRRHKLDRTVAGFLYRALLATPVQVLRGRRSVAQAIANCKAAFQLPLIHLGLAQDFWQPFQSYLQAEAGLPSTFFVVPFKHHPGRRSPQGGIEAARGVPYEAREVGEQTRTAHDRGCEIALHGLDAWDNPQAGRLEREQVEQAAECSAQGVRMHWLYFDEKSPQALEEAGFGYDATWGYNDAVGYRSGTSQAFRWPSTRHLLELPLLVQDTALFYPGRMGLGEEKAWGICEGLLENATRFGGSFVINWHGRSLAPERLWGGFHNRLLERLRSDRACFLTAAQAVEWFRVRRTVRFEGTEGDKVRWPAVQPDLPPLKTWRWPSSGATVLNNSPTSRKIGTGGND